MPVAAPVTTSGGTSVVNTASPPLPSPAVFVATTR